MLHCLVGFLGKLMFNLAQAYVDFTAFDPKEKYYGGTLALDLY